MAQDPQAGNADKALKRLSKEKKKLDSEKLDFAEILGPPDKKQPLIWHVVVQGPKDSVYEGGKFKVEIQFTDQYPMKAPELKFITKIYHPSVRQKDGAVCPEIIGKDWAPVLNVKFICETIQKMLSDPKTDSPLEESIAQEMAENRKKFEKTAKQWTKKHAK